MLKLHRLFIAIGIIFIILIALAVSFSGNKIESDFKKWVSIFSKELEKEGISLSTIESFKKNIQLSQSIVQSFEQKNKPTVVSAYNQVFSIANDDGILSAQVYFKDNIDLLKAKQKEYQLSPSVAVAMLFVGSGFGKNFGTEKLINILATQYIIDQTKTQNLLELKSFLRLVDKNQVNINDFGNLDGTFTYLGITPTTHLYYAKDGNSNGSIDLFNSKEDIIETAFNLLAKNGYKSNETALNRITTSTNLSNLQGLANAKNTEDWKALGVSRVNNLPLPSNTMASIFMLNSNTGALIYHNFNIILKSNNSIYKSLAIGLIAEELDTYYKLIDYKATKVKPTVKPKYVAEKSTKKKDDKKYNIKGTK